MIKVKIYSVTILLLSLFSLDSLGKVKRRSCPSNARFYTLEKAPPKGKPGIKRKRAFFLEKNPEGSYSFIWCEVKKRGKKTSYKYKGQLEFSSVSEVILSNRMKKKSAFSKKKTKVATLTFYFINTSNKRSILYLEECSDKKIGCSPASQIAQLHKKLLSLTKEKKIECERGLTNSCQGLPFPLYMDRETYCQDTFYETRDKRKYDFFIRADRPDQVKLPREQKVIYRFLDSNSTKAIAGAGFYLKSNGYKFNKERPNRLWQWTSLRKKCNAKDFKELKEEIKKEFASKEYREAYNKKAYIETNKEAGQPRVNNKIAVFVLGAAASGKTTTTKNGISIAINNHFCPKGKSPFCNIKLLSIDGGLMRDVSVVWLDLKEIANDMGYIGFSDQYKTFRPHFKYLKNILISRAIQRGENLVIPETASSEVLKARGPVRKLIDVLHKNGYKILMTSIYVKKKQAKTFGSKRAKQEGKTYRGTAWGFSQEQAEILMNYVRNNNYSPKLPMYFFNNDKDNWLEPRNKDKGWTIKDSLRWFSKPGVKITIPPGCRVKRNCNAVAGTCKFKPVCS